MATTTPVTAIDSTMKKYLSGKEAQYRSICGLRCSQRRKDEYLSSSISEVKPPGAATIASGPPTPRFNSDAPDSWPDCRINAAKCATSLGNGRSRKRAMRLRSAARSGLAAGGADGCDDVGSESVGIYVLRELQERFFERGHQTFRSYLVNRAVGDYRSVSQQHQVRAHLFHHLEHRGAEEDGAARSREQLHHLAEDQRHRDIESGERLVKNENFGIVHQRRDEHNTLAHTFGIRRNR